jgi:hypothetical protein
MAPLYRNSGNQPAPLPAVCEPSISGTGLPLTSRSMPNLVHLRIMTWRPGHTRSVIAALDFSHTAGRRIPYASSPYGYVMQLEQARNEPPAQTEGAGISTLLDSRESRPWSIARFGAVVTTTRQHL